MGATLILVIYGAASLKTSRYHNAVAASSNQTGDDVTRAPL